MYAWVAHAVGIALLGALLPSGEHLAWLHRLVSPVVELIPNAIRITNRSPDPVFAQTFIGLSLVIALLMLLYFILAMRGYHTKAFESTWKRFLALFYNWVVAGVIMLGILWFMPYLDPLSKGRAYFLLNAATSSTAGVFTVMNQLVVGMPLACPLSIWLGHACTTVRHRAGFI
jgi:heme/copper-type cytochrome/quinol oxidase subunit 4